MYILKKEGLYNPSFLVVSFVFFEHALQFEQLLHPVQGDPDLKDLYIYLITNKTIIIKISNVKKVEIFMALYLLSIDVG